MITLTLACLVGIFILFVVIATIIKNREYHRTPHEIAYESDEFLKLDLKECEYSKVDLNSNELSVWKGKYGYYCFDVDGEDVFGPFASAYQARMGGEEYFK